TFRCVGHRTPALPATGAGDRVARGAERRHRGRGGGAERYDECVCRTFLALPALFPPDPQFLCGVFLCRLRRPASTTSRVVIRAELCSGGVCGHHDDREGPDSLHLRHAVPGPRDVEGWTLSSAGRE